MKIAIGHLINSIMLVSLLFLAGCSRPPSNAVMLATLNTDFRKAYNRQGNIKFGATGGFITETGT